MDKRVAAQGITRLQGTHTMKHVKNLRSIPKNEDNKNFAIDRNEFPSLHEVSDRIGSHGKSPLELNKSLSYSEKLKKVPCESKSSLKFEATSEVSNSSSALVRENFMKNTTPFKSRVQRNPKTNCESTAPESPIEVTQSAGQFSNQDYSKATKIKLSDKGHKTNSSERNVSLMPNQRSVCTTNDGRASRARIGTSSENHQKFNSQNRRSVIPNRTLNSQSISTGTNNLKIVGIFKNAGPCASNKKIDVGTSSFQNSISISEGNSNNDNKGVHPELTHLQPEVKKKKKRKSKVKRQAALQTGKIFVLTPEAHSRIFNQSNNTSSKIIKNAVVNINDCDEYPELGTSILPKCNKENTAKQMDLTSKNTSVVSNKSELEVIDFESNSGASQHISVSGKTEVAVLKEDTGANTKSSDSEKAPLPVKDPSTLSLFDMLLAKSRKIEADKKNELVIQNSPSSAAKPLSKILGKKGISYAVNPLDSSRPAVKRGKERETPKIKKPSRMRKLILLGRQLRKEEMTTLDNSEKTDTACTGVSNDDLSPLKMIESISDAFDENSTSHAENFIITDNEYLDNEGSPSNENNSEISSSHDESQSEQNESTNNSQYFSNNFVVKTVLAKGSCKIKTDIVSSSDSVNNRENKGSNESIDDELLNKISNKSSSSNKLATSHIRKGEEQALVDTISICDDLGDDEICILDETSAYAETENHYLEMRKVINSALDEKKPIPSLEDCNKHNHNLLTYQTFPGCIIINDSDSNILEESPSILCSVDKENDSILEADCPLKIKTSTSFVFKNDKDTSSVALGSVNSEELLKKDQNNFKSNSSENTASLNPLLEQVGNDISNNSISDEENSEAVKTMIHSRKFRKYCNHFTSKEIDKVVFALLDDLARFQDRLHQKDPVKARVRKRLLYGIKEIKRHMKLKKLKGIILATDIEDIKTEGGLNDVVDQIISLAEAYHIPYIFSHRRFNLGKVCRKGVAVSCVGIFNYEGSEKNFKRILELQEESKQDYLKVIKALDSVLSNNQKADVLKLGKGVPEKLYAVRTNIMREYFKPDTNSTDGELIASEVSTTNVEVVDSEDPNESVSNLFLETNISEPNKIDKNEIYSILLKYSIL